jgi:hypothetical protein
MWFEVAVGAFMLGEFIYHRWVEGDPPPPKPGKLTLPQTDEGSPIPLIYGRCRVRAPVLAWAGNWFPERTGIVFHYFLNMLWVVGAPFFGGLATLQGIYVNNFVLVLVTRAPFPGTPPLVAGRFTYVTSNGSTLFGGPGAGGGIDGQVEYFDGRPGQQISDEHNDRKHITEVEAVLTGDIPENPSPDYTTSSIDASQIPGFRNLALCFLWQWELGEAPNMVPYSFEVTSLSTGTAADLGQSLSNDADPAAVIFDVLTSPWGRLGLPISKVDQFSFQAASRTLFAENHGYSRAIEQVEDAPQIIGDVLRQVDGVMYEEPTTGRLELHLVRNDYNVAGLDDINPDNARLVNYSVQGQTETFNQVRVTFTDRANAYANGTVIGQNGANVTDQGGRLRSIDLGFPGCCDRNLAQKLASRELAAVSRPLAKATVECNRSFHRARPGQVFTFTWPELEIDHMVMRVGRVDLGQLHQGQIVLDLIRDIFDVSNGAFPVAT